MEWNIIRLPSKFHGRRERSKKRRIHFYMKDRKESISLEEVVTMNGSIRLFRCYGRIHRKARCSGCGLSSNSLARNWPRRGTCLLLGRWHVCFSCWWSLAVRTPTVLTWSSYKHSLKSLSWNLQRSRKCWSVAAIPELKFRNTWYHGPKLGIESKNRFFFFPVTNWRKHLRFFFFFLKLRSNKTKVFLFVEVLKYSNTRWPTDQE